MPRFNKTASPTRVTNLAGGVAYTESPKQEFVSILLTSFVQQQFYRGADETIVRVAELVRLVPHEFAAKAAIFARDEFGMRSISHVVAGELAAVARGAPWLKRFVERIVVRPDDITEILAYYGERYSLKPTPHSLKKGLAAAFAKFDEYQLAKYRGEGRAISLVDAVRLCHPKSTPAIEALVYGRLVSEDTWEARLTQAGQRAETDEDKAENKAEAWRELVESRKLGYFALLRNLRNIVEQAPQVVTDACELLMEEGLIRRSRVLPFRYMTAQEEVEKISGDSVRLVLEAIGKAFEIAVGNVPHLAGKTLIALDDSGSMQSHGLRKGTVDKAVPLAAVLYATQNADMVLFSDTLRWFNANPSYGVSVVMDLLRREVGRSGGTNFNLIFENASRKYDRVIILSDMQAWMAPNNYYTSIGGAPNQTHAEYCKRTGANPHIYSWDLAGYGSLAFPQERVYALAGFSEKVFDIMDWLERDRDALASRIEAVEI